MTVTDKYSQIYNNQYKLIVVLIIYSVQYEVPRDLECLTNMYKLNSKKFQNFHFQAEIVIFNGKA